MQLAKFDEAPNRGQFYTCTNFHFRNQVEVILLKIFRDTLPCAVILCVAPAIRHGNPEKHGNVAESGRIESWRGCGLPITHKSNQYLI